MNVTYPDVSPSAKKCMHSILSRYFARGGIANIGSRVVHFTKSDLQFHREIDQPSRKTNSEPNEPLVEMPTISIIGSREGDSQKMKCVSNGKPIFVYKNRIYYNLVVGVTRGGSRIRMDRADRSVEQNSYEVVDQIWSQLRLVIDHHANEFAEMGLRQIDMPMIPQDISDEHQWAGRGTLEANITVAAV